MAHFIVEEVVEIVFTESALGHPAFTCDMTINTHIQDSHTQMSETYIHPQAQVVVDEMCRKYGYKANVSKGEIRYVRWHFASAKKKGIDMTTGKPTTPHFEVHLLDPTFFEHMKDQQPMSFFHFQRQKVCSFIDEVTEKYGIQDIEGVDRAHSGNLERDLQHLNIYDLVSPDRLAPVNHKTHFEVQYLTIVPVGDAEAFPLLDVWVCFP